MTDAQLKLGPPELSTTVSKATNERMKKIAVYFPDRTVTEYDEARFFFVSVKNCRGRAFNR